MDYIAVNSEKWDAHVAEGYIWTRPVPPQIIEEAKKGKWSVVLTPHKCAPRDWFPDDLRGKKVLLIAGGGGQQGPVLAAAGADVTVFDNSPAQLMQDELVAAREGLSIRTVQGNMQDLSVFADESFDVIMQFAGAFVDSVLPVWKEAHRVLRDGGVLLAGHNSPVEFIFDLERMEQANELVVRHSLPYSDLTDLTEEEFQRVTATEGVCFGHTLTELIQGQIDAGFLIAGFYEDKGGSVLDAYIDTFFATKAICKK